MASPLCYIMLFIVFLIQISKENRERDIETILQYDMLSARMVSCVSFSI